MMRGAGAARTLAVLAIVAAFAFAPPASAHDPSAWGGLFRSRDDGAAWQSADAGLFVGAALALAVNPRDANDLLYGTDTRLLRSRNGGRDWVPQAPHLFNGPTLALAFAPDGKGAWAATPAGIFVADAEFGWSKSEVPAAAVPGRALVPGTVPGRVYLLGARGLYASSDHGRSFMRIGLDQLPDSSGHALIVVPVEPERLLAIFGGRILTSTDGGTSWAPRDAGLPRGQVGALAADSGQRGRLWAASSDFSSGASSSPSGSQIHISDDLGLAWRPRGKPFGASGLSIRGLAAANGGALLLLATHKGLLRSTDGGDTWAQVEGTLPVHLEAGTLVRDAHDAQTVYAGFSLVPYAELRRRAEQGSNLLSQVDPVSLAGAGAFLLLMLIGGWSGARALAQAYRHD